MHLVSNTCSIHVHVHCIHLQYTCTCTLHTSAHVQCTCTCHTLAAKYMYMLYVTAAFCCSPSILSSPLLATFSPSHHLLPLPCVQGLPTVADRGVHEPGGPSGCAQGLQAIPTVGHTAQVCKSCGRWHELPSQRTVSHATSHPKNCVFVCVMIA